MIAPPCGNAPPVNSRQWASSQFFPLAISTLQRHFKFDDFFHFFFDERHDFFFFFYRRFENKFIMHLHNQTGGKIFFRKQMSNVHHRHFNQIGGGSLNRSVDRHAFGKLPHGRNLDFSIPAGSGDGSKACRQNHPGARLPEFHPDRYALFYSAENIRQCMPGRFSWETPSSLARPKALMP